MAFSLRRVSSSPSARPTVIPRPITVTSAPRSARRSGGAAPRSPRVHGSGPGSPSTRRPRFSGCRPSASLSGSIWLSTRFASIPAWAVAAGRGTRRRPDRRSARPPRPRSAPGCVGRQVPADTGDTTLAQSRRSPLTYARLPGSSPTRTASAAGSMPRAASAIRPGQLSLYRGRAAFPSRVIACTVRLLGLVVLLVGLRYLPGCGMVLVLELAAGELSVEEVADAGHDRDPPARPPRY